jgi:hypothetical protein
VRERKQIDAIVALVIGLIAIAFGQAVGIILQLMPFLAVSLVVLLVLMLLIGMANKEGDWDKTFPKGLRTGLMCCCYNRSSCCDACHNRTLGLDL